MNRNCCDIKIIQAITQELGGPTLKNFPVEYNKNIQMSAYFTLAQHQAMTMSLKL